MPSADDVDELAIDQTDPATRMFTTTLPPLPTLLAADTNVKVVSERLGHATVGFTLDVYAHVMPASRPTLPRPSRHSSISSRERRTLRF
jgi:hypothetical protein